MPSKLAPKQADTMSYRASSLSVDASGRPSTIDEKARSVESVIATENPVRSYSYNFDGPFDELLLVSGVVIPTSGQVPLLDTHSRYQTSSVLGSTRNIRVEGNTLIGRDFFSSVEDAQDPWTKTVEGHLTDRSAGFSYSTNDAVLVDIGQTAVIEGRSFTAGNVVPLVVVKIWALRENSLCAIGADETAKTRSLNEPENRGTQTMDAALKAYLITRGLSVTATDEDAEAFALTLRADTGVPAIVPAIVPAVEGVVEAGRASAPGVIVAPVDPTAAVNTAITNERARVGEITAMCTSFGMEDAFRIALVDGGEGVDAARAKVMAQMVLTPNPADNVGFRTAVVGLAEGSKFVDAAGDALILRAGVVVEKPAAGALDLRGLTLVEMARQCLGYSGARHISDPMQMVGRALTTSDLPLLLSNVANKTLMSAFELQASTWEQWCGVGTVSDFKQYTEVGVSAGGLLKVIKERGEYDFDDLSDESFSYSIQTLGKMFGFSRQMIINDDLGALAKIGQFAGESAQRTLNRLAYKVLLDNAALADTIALFHADHGNVGTGGLIGTTTLDQGKRLMQLQRGAADERLNIKAEYILAPTGAEVLAEEFFINTVYDASEKDATRKNRYNGTTLKRIYDAELDLDTDTGTAWYMAGQKGKTVNMNFLNGNRVPFLDSREGWNQDGIEWKIRIDAGASIVTYKALVLNAGA